MPKDKSPLSVRKHLPSRLSTLDNIVLKELEASYLLNPSPDLLEKINALKDELSPPPLRRSLTLTYAQISSYLSNDNLCPVCGSNKIESLGEAYYVDTLRMDGELGRQVHHEVGCNSCYADWVDVYQNHDIATTEIDKLNPIGIEQVTIKTTPSVKFIMED